ncbi:MAG TPA: methylated-DNA--[protein]-cysteine S-methyltransferase [Gemmatimonadaceae bacterium]
MTHGFALFGTAFGCCGIVWTEHGIACTQLPERSEVETRARLLRRFPDARETLPSPEARAAIDGIVALLGGEASDLTTIVLDMDTVPTFHRRVYDVTRKIQRGSTRTYGELAAALGDPGAARAVGRALGANPFAPVIPCHRVLAAGGKLGGFSARGGVDTKLRMLAMEGGAGPLFD